MLYALVRELWDKFNGGYPIYEWYLLEIDKNPL